MSQRENGKKVTLSTHLLTAIRDLSNVGRDLAHGRRLLLQTEPCRLWVKLNILDKRKARYTHSAL